jgi:hypothetical protein
MSTYDLTLDTLNCSGTRYIEVDFGTVKVDAGDTLRFINDLTPKKDAFLWVYKVGNKSGPPISGFCDGWGSSLKIENDASGSGEGICVVTSSGTFQYKITADMHEELDPIIIVEPKIESMTSLADVVESPAGGLLALAVLGGVASYSYLHGRNIGRSHR